MPLTLRLTLTTCPTFGDLFAFADAARSGGMDPDAPLDPVLGPSGAIEALEVYGVDEPERGVPAREHFLGAMSKLAEREPLEVVEVIHAAAESIALSFSSARRRHS